MKALAGDAKPSQSIRPGNCTTLGQLLKRIMDKELKKVRLNLETKNPGIYVSRAEDIFLSDTLSKNKLLDEEVGVTNGAFKKKEYYSLSENELQRSSELKQLRDAESVTLYLKNGNRTDGIVRRIGDPPNTKLVLVVSPDIAHSYGAPPAVGLRLDIDWGQVDKVGRMPELGPASFGLMRSTPRKFKVSMGEVPNTTSIEGSISLETPVKAAAHPEINGAVSVPAGSKIKVADTSPGGIPEKGKVRLIVIDDIKAREGMRYLYQGRDEIWNVKVSKDNKRLYIVRRKIKERDKTPVIVEIREIPSLKIINTFTDTQKNIVEVISATTDGGALQVKALDGATHSYEAHQVYDWNAP